MIIPCPTESNAITYHLMTRLANRPSNLSRTSRNDANWGPGFTLIELLVVVLIIGVLAALLLPALARAKTSAKRVACVSNLRQIGLALSMYMQDHGGQFPDRRDLKSSLPGGYKPWSSWPVSDPRTGWAAHVLLSEIPNAETWVCPSIRSSTSLWAADQCRQSISNAVDAPVATYWMWRFDRMLDPVPRDNFWGKTETQVVADLIAENNPFIGVPEGPADVEVAVDPYFPGDKASLPDTIRGRAAHPGGFNRLMLDWHIEFKRDSRLQ